MRTELAHIKAHAASERKLESLGNVVCDYVHGHVKDDKSR